VGKRARRKFTAEFKADTVALVRKEANELGGRGISRIARDLDLTESAVRLWVRQAGIDAGRGPEGALTTDERKELERLRKENRVLRMEREILKKATAFFARESQ
jgi:transposase